MAQMMAVMMAVQAVSSIAGGMAKQSAGEKEARALEGQGLLAEQESAVDAQIHATQVRKFAANQKSAFLKNGVTLDGSPLAVLEDTRKSGQEEVNAIMRSGAAKAQLYRDRAEITRSEGRAALIGGIGSGIGSFTQSSMAAYGSNIFNTTKPTVPAK